MKREFFDYVEDVIEAMSNSEEFVRGMKYEEFIRDQKTIYAVVRALEIIGEAVRKIPASVRNQHPEIPWKNMAGMRDKLIHEYFGVNFRIVWDAVQKDIPPLKPLFEKILKESPSK